MVGDEEFFLYKVAARVVLRLHRTVILNRGKALPSYISMSIHTSPDSEITGRSLAIFLAVLTLCWERWPKK